MKRAKRGATRVRKQEAKRKKSCEGKQKHETEAGAIDQLFSLKRKLGVRIHGMRAYECEFCGSYHVGHHR